jgi:transcriptional regulator with XRE-family HTH domain
MAVPCYSLPDTPRENRVVKIPRLRELRERALLTQADLAAKSGVSEVTINRVERGRHEPRISTARKLAEALGAKPAELMGLPQRGEGR